MSLSLAIYINNQRLANGGDDQASFVVQWSGCTLCGLFDNTRFEDRENYYGSGHAPQLVLFDPTAATLVSFSAQPELTGNLVAWTTAQELSVAGFNVYRASAPDGEKILLNPALIPAMNPGALMGNAYQYKDRSAPPGAISYYWLEIRDMDGSKTWEVSGPVLTNSTLFLPLMQK